MRKWAAPDTRRGLAYFFALLGNFFSSSIGESVKLLIDKKGNVWVAHYNQGV